MGEEYRGGRDIRDRTFQLAVRVVQLCEHLDARPGVSRSIGNQLLRSGTAVGANLEQAKAGHTKADFAAKAAISLKEARETHFWLRLIVASNLIAQSRVDPLLQECDEVIRIIAKIIINTRKDAS